MILLTGASEGIGHACALMLLQRTVEPVLITGRDPAKLARARDALPPAERARLLTRVCDQADRQQTDDLAAWIRSVADLSGAVLCVGTNPMYAVGPQKLHAVDPDTIETTIRTNCTHTTLLSAALLERFRARRSGTLVWIGSGAAAGGLPGAAVYSATKAFLSGLARSAHNEYARHGIRVLLVHPSLVRTPRTAAVVDHFAARHGMAVAEPADVAEVIVARMLDAPAPTRAADVEVAL
jgi:hypothetical protein